MKCKHEEEEQQHQGRIYYCAMLIVRIAYSFQYIFHKCVPIHTALIWIILSADVRVCVWQFMRSWAEFVIKHSC